jgi:two-component system cell cycle response regulator
MTAALHRRAALAFAALMAFAIALMIVRVWWRFGSDALFGDWLYNGVILGSAALAAWRGLALPGNRAAWLLIALGLASWFAGDVWWVIHSEDSYVPIPSLADWLYFGLYPPFAIALVLLARERMGSASRMLALDGLIGVFAVGALSAAFVLEPVLDNPAGDTVAMAVTVAFPVCDIVLIGLVVQTVALGGWTLSRGWLLLVAGLVTFAVADGIYYAQIAEGTYAEWGLLDNAWPFATLLVGLAAWQPERRARRATDSGWSQLVAPGLFAAVGLAVAAYAYAARTNPFAMGLACAAGIAVIVRMVATFRQNLVLLAEARREAVTDALTGLGNRRRLLADLERRGEGGLQVLVLADLNGFKRYNDTFGHAAGDALLNRLGARLAAATAGHGRAYRMGGDEFCVLLDGGGIAPAEASELVAAALSEHGEGFAVDASCGTVELPAEAAGAVAALRLADTRMYERKRAGHPSAEEQGVALLLRLLSERDPDLGDHVNGVAELAAAVAERLELPAHERDDIRRAAALHDIGKLAIPDSILAKPGPLDDDEWAFMRRHTLIGERILGGTPGLAGVAALVRSSHERLDGKGYPDRLAADEIPLGARIVAVCDAYHAMVSDRPYRRAMPHTVALVELRAGAGTQFDGAVVEEFAAVVEARRPIAA